MLNATENCAKEFERKRKREKKMIQKRMFYLIEISQMRNKIAVHAWKRKIEKNALAPHTKQHKQHLRSHDVVVGREKNSTKVRFKSRQIPAKGNRN